MQNNEKIAGLLLTGGASRRMGSAKAELQIEGETLARRAAGLLGRICDPVLEIGPGYSHLAAVREHPPFSGPLAAFSAGAGELERLGYRGPVLVLAVDMPFVGWRLLELLAAGGDAETSVVPVVDGEPQSLCARYSRAAVREAITLAAGGARSMKSLTERIKVDWMTEAEWGKVAAVDAFFDLDTPEDLRRMGRSDAESLSDEPTRRSTRRVEVLKVGENGWKRRTDTLASEEPMEIRLSGPGGDPVSVAVTMRTPGHDFELAAGFLLSEALAGPRDIASIKYCEIPRDEQNYNVVTVKLLRPFEAGVLKRNFYANSSCGICGKASLEQVQVHCAPVAGGPVFEPSVIRAMPEALSQRQRIFRETGGLHAAGLFDGDGKLVTLREDVGRHNACDKVFGSALLSGKLPLTGYALCVSGRLSFEIVQKAAMAGVPVVVAVSAPSSLAVQAAETLGITLAGFVRGDGFNLYTHPERVADEGRTSGKELE